ncbi:MAG: hypothetical protein IIC53_05785, partial [Proteobacteria bacterium]|nr:hypothetical protein [Pseudomonadota bacterium]
MPDFELGTPASDGDRRSDAGSAQLERRDRELAELQKRFERAQTDLQSFSDALDQRAAECAEQEASLVAATAELETKKRTATAHIEEARTDLESARSKNKESEEELAAVRSQIDQTQAELKQRVEEDYREIIEKEQAALTKIGTSIELRLREWTSPSANLSLNWHFDRDKSFTIHEPNARISIGEDNFIGDIARLGHGMQRSFIVSIL